MKIASGNQIESGTATRPRRQVIGEDACAAFAAMALLVDDSDEQTTLMDSQDRATIPMHRVARHDTA